MTFENQTFTNEDINLDFNEFVGCRFEQCAMVFRGLGVVQMDECEFVDCQWTLVDAAAKTVNLLTTLYGAGEWGKRLTERTFENIRKGVYVGGEELLSRMNRNDADK